MLYKYNFIEFSKTETAGRRLIFVAGQHVASGNFAGHSFKQIIQETSNL